ncbi:MAG: sigma-54-dependent Fis family transcriptional regulator [Planctomycetota bacterium]|nr:MAG: sigma-54-dependent Fis family transcriptional regulator [Planctomycetota bacterium]
MAKATILLVEDEAPQRALLHQMLQDEGYEVVEAGSAEQALECLQQQRFDLVLSDWKLPGANGMELFRNLQSQCPEVAFVMVSAYGTIARAVDAVRAGADDYLAKPFTREAVLLSVERSLRARRLEDENRRLNQALSERDRLVDMIGRAPGMQRLYRQLEKVAGTEATVLLCGESGTGKELAARALHTLSARNAGPFVAVNCAAIPTGLAEAEFFGACKGAYSGSDRDRPGYFQMAQQGTLFLDEIAELAPDLQAKLLRAIQDKKIRRIGGNQEENVEVRLVAATHRNLEDEVAAGRFREDLFYRLNVLQLQLPPLRERKEDIPLLADHFLDLFAKRHGITKPRLPTEARRRLLDHPWPGNVRQLANAVERAVLLSEDGQVTPSDLPELPAASQAIHFKLDPQGIQWEAFEKEALSQALELAGGNRSRAARLLDLPYKAFLYRLEKHGISGQAR